MSDAQNAGEGSNGAGGTQNADQQPQGQGAGEGTKPGEQPQGQQPQGEAKPGEQKPDEVAFKAELPEGVELDQASLDEFTKIVKDKDLSPSDRAQKLFDLAAKREAERAQAFADTVQGWADQCAKDAELGKPENQAAARKVIEDLGTPELKSLLNSTGMGNHPDVVRFVLKVSKALSEDAIHRSRGDAPGAPKSAAEVLYGTPNQS